MTTLNTIVLVLHVLIGAMIVGLVLMQRGKGADAGAAFGAGASGTVFGARGSANFLSRSTAVLAALFFITSLSLAYLGAQRRPPESVLDLAPAASAPAVGPSAEPTGAKDSSGKADVAGQTPVTELPALPAPALPGPASPGPDATQPGK